MVLLLVADVAGHLWKIGDADADAERCITSLPREFLLAGLAEPFRGIGLHEPHAVGYRQGRRKLEQHVNMILHAVDDYRLAAKPTDDATEICAQSRADLVMDDRQPAFRTEHYVHVQTAKRMGHFCRPLWGWAS